MERGYRSLERHQRSEISFKWNQELLCLCEEVASDKLIIDRHRHWSFFFQLDQLLDVVIVHRKLFVCRFVIPSFVNLPLERACTLTIGLCLVLRSCLLLRTGALSDDVLPNKVKLANSRVLVAYEERVLCGIGPFGNKPRLTYFFTLANCPTTAM